MTDIYHVLGVRVDAVQIPDVTRIVESWIEQRNGTHYVAVTGMHGVCEAQKDSNFRAVLNQAGLVVADGMPIVWLGRLRGNDKMKRRVYGPEMMLAICRDSVKNGYRHYLYGGAPGVADELAQSLRQRFPGIQIVGTHCPPFRPLTDQEKNEVEAQINAAAPDLVWVGMSTPKQEMWMAEFSRRLNVPVMFGVGAAFDFISGRVPQAPEVMQENGLEWLFRLAQEPRRLWRRYLINGPKFISLVLLETMKLKRFGNASQELPTRSASAPVARTTEALSSGSVSVIGLGKLGACMAATVASKGRAVIGVDLNAEVVDAVNSGRAPVVERGLEELAQSSRSRLRATLDVEEAVLASDISFIVVPTPSDADGSFSLRHVLQAAREIGRALRRKNGYHLVVVTSTVLPGATGNQVLPVLERESGKRCGSDFGLCYSPEFIALGSVIRDLMEPDFILVGESDECAGAMLADFYRWYCTNRPPIERMNFVNAELTKIAVNTYVTMKISYANMLAGICEKLPGADVDVVSAAVGHDARIGRKYLTGGIGYGGPCFPRDNKALAALAQRLGAAADLASATDAMNGVVLERLMERVRQTIPAGGRVAILGLAYKPHTDVVEESQGLELARMLAGNGTRVAVYDAMAMQRASDVLGDMVEYCASAAACIANADVVVITTPDPEFAALAPEQFPAREPRIVLLDCWRLLASKIAGCAHIDYVPLGIHAACTSRASAMEKAV